ACADGGDLFSFVMKREGYDFKEALQHLAERAGVQLDSSPEKSEQDQQRQKFLELNAAAATYFHNLLTNSPVGAQARAYLLGRELTAETIAAFQLGYAPDAWEGLKTHFIERGYTAADLLEAGLIVERDDKSSSYDRFRNRLMIPIRNPQGRVIGFGARALAEDQVPKYLNSPQTRLFDKSKTLYGLDLARNHIRTADQAVIVEGYMDVIQAYQRGAKNVVAQMGTALTEQQLKILKRTTNNFVLALDSDAAGNTAALRGVSVARQALDRETVPVLTSRGLIRYEGRLEANIRIAALPEGKDPDDILKEGLAVWQGIIEQAVPVVDYYFQMVTATLDLDTAKGKSAAVRELIPILRDVSNPVEQQHYIQKLARLVHIDERTLTAELKGVQAGPAGGRPRKQATRPVTPPASLPPEEVVTASSAGRIDDTSPSAKLESYCLGLILANPAALVKANKILEEYGISGLTINDINRGGNREIFQALQLWSAAQTPKLDTLVEMVGETLAPYLANLASQWHNKPSVSNSHMDRDLSIAILRLRLQNVNEQINELTFLQRESMEEELENNTTRRYIEAVEQYKQERKRLEQIRDTLTLAGQRRLETNLYGEVSDTKTKF
ncbi:MAG: DNA primase, partial [Anaerolineae bacterium]|nr:DNA primase [Anaerolineae bacterium]